jgi:acyl CoA:acetate/3-ketoacid CoA transferase beta subunit
MQHMSGPSVSKLARRCTLSLTGVKCDKKVVTDLAVLDVTPAGFKLLERAPGGRSRKSGTLPKDGLSLKGTFRK